MLILGLTIKETVVYFYSPTFHFRFWGDRDPKGELGKETEKMALELKTGGGGVGWWPRSLSHSPPPS